MNCEGVKRPKPHLRIRASYYFNGGERLDFRNATAQLYAALVETMQGEYLDGAEIIDEGEKK